MKKAAFYRASLLLVFCFSTVVYFTNTNSYAKPEDAAFLIQTTLFEKDGDTKIFVKSVKHTVRYHDSVVYDDDALGLKLVFGWTWLLDAKDDLIPVDDEFVAKFKNKLPMKHTFEIQAKSTNIYLAPLLRFNTTWRVVSNGDRSTPWELLKARKQVNLDALLSRHIILDHVGIFNFDDPEKYYRVYEIHVKIKPVVSAPAR